MEKKSSSGCPTALIVVVVILVLLLAVPVAGFLWFKSSVSERQREIHREAASRMAEAHSSFGNDEHAVILQQDELERISLPKAGEPISREQWVAFTTGESHTALSRNTFRDQANGATVRWMLRTEDILEKNQELHGRFSIPWEVRHAHGSTGSSVQVDATFTKESRPELLRLKRGDWAHIEGTLSLNGGATIVSARLSSGAEASGKETLVK